jgi:hypothetical protein
MPFPVDFSAATRGNSRRQRAEATTFLTEGLPAPFKK